MGGRAHQRMQRPSLNSMCLCVCVYSMEYMGIRTGVAQASWLKISIRGKKKKRKKETHTRGSTYSTTCEELTLNCIKMRCWNMWRAKQTSWDLCNNRFILVEKKRAKENCKLVVDPVVCFRHAHGSPSTVQPPLLWSGTFFHKALTSVEVGFARLHYVRTCVSPLR